MNQRVAIVVIVTVVIVVGLAGSYMLGLFPISPSATNTSTTTTGTTSTALPTSLSWQAGSDIFSEPLNYTSSEVTYNVSTGSLPITYVLGGATPHWWYQVGIHLVWSDCTQVVSQFGQFTAGCPNYHCSLGPGGTATEGVELGVLATDGSGDGSFHVDIRNIVPGTYHGVFEVRQGIGCCIDVDNPGRNCQIVFQAPNFGAPATIVIPG